MTEQHECAERVWGAFHHHHPCSRRGVLLENGKWWCKQHAPSTKKARQEKDDAKMEARQKAWKRESERKKALRDLMDGAVAARAAGLPGWAESSVERYLNNQEPE